MEYKELILVCGFSRSGTTWLAKILDALPNVLFVSEPDKRIYSDLKFGKVSHCSNLEDNKNEYILYKKALQEVVDMVHCNLMTFPFFKKQYCNVPYTLYWIFAAIYKFFSSRLCLNLRLPPFLFKKNEKVNVVWKSVNQSSNLSCLKNAFHSIKIVYIVRNPYATITSMFQHKKMAMDGEDLRRIAERQNSIFFQKNPINKSDILSMSDIQKRSLLWRIECESAYWESHTNPSIHMVLYEDLVRNPWDVVKNICSFLSCPFSPEIQKFLKQSTGEIKPPLISRILSTGYFGVYRKQNVDVTKWKKKLSREYYNQINEIVKDSPLIHNWED
ncbi:MAG: sulfotransferase [Desulfamplus sp.]|nr:sulfotransferase [Desulfamplus sp.]